MKLIRFLVFATLVVTLHGLFSCRATRPPEATEPPRDYSRNEGTPYGPPVPDSVVVKPHRSLLDKLTGRTPSSKSIKSGALHQVGKKSTVSIYYGPATVTTNTAAKKAAAGTGATTVTKPDAPVATGAGDAVDLARAQASANIKGDGNAPVLSNTAPEAPGVGATIAGAIATPAGKVVGLVVVGLLGYGVYRLWPVLRRRTPPNTTA